MGLKKYIPVVYSGIVWFFLKEEKDGKSKLIRLQNPNDFQYGYPSSDKISTILVDSKDIVSYSGNLSRDDSHCYAKIIGHEKSSAEYGYSDRRKNFINSIGVLTFIEGNQLNILMAGSYTLSMVKSEVELMGMNINHKYRAQYKNGDYVIAKKDINDTSIDRGDVVRVVEITNNSEDKSYDTMTVQKEEGVKVLVKQKMFKLLKKHD